MSIHFIHIPKTAGTSIINAIGGEGRSHKKYQQILADGCNENDFIFTCVRNPYDRAVSSFLFNKNLVERARQEGASPSFSHYTDAASNVDDFWSNKVSDIFWRCFRRTIFMQPQYKWVEDAVTGDIGNRINCILRYETLKEDWQKLQNLYGFPDLNYDNVTQGKSNHDWSDLLSDKAKSRIAQLYARDFSLFNYTI